MRLPTATTAAVVMLTQLASPALGQTNGTSTPSAPAQEQGAEQPPGNAQTQGSMREMMRQMMPFITGSGNVYRAQIVGYFDQMGPPCRVETVIDASNATTGGPRIVFWRDISNLGRGFGLDTLGAGPAQ